MRDIKRDIKRDIANWPNAILQGRHGEIRDIKRDIVWPNGPLGADFGRLRAKTLKHENSEMQIAKVLKLDVQL